MTAEADSLGSYLRGEREARRVSLQDISAVTKVQLKFLEALETDNYDQLPPTPFVVGFLRAYAQCLALEPSTIIAAYYAHRNRSQEDSGARVFVVDQEKRWRFGWVSLGFVAAVIVLVTSFVWRLSTVHQEGRTAQSVPRPVQEHTETPRLRDVPEAPGVASDAQASRRVRPEAAASLPQAVSPSGRASPPASSSEDALVAELSVTETVVVPPAVPTTARFVLHAFALEDTWLRVEIDDDERYEWLLRAGNDRQWEATERFVLTVGNAQGTRLMLNGRDLPLPPTQDNVVRDFVLTREAVQ